MTETQQFRVGASYTVVLPPKLSAVETILRERLAARQKNWQFSRAAQYGWDGFTRLYRAGSNRFPSGFIWRVHELLRDAGIQAKWEFSTEKPKLHQEAMPHDLGITLRPYQNDAVALALKKGRGCLEVGTGGGKTAIGAEIIRQLGVPTLWLIHRQQLMLQTQRELSKFLDQPVGVIAGKKMDLQPVTVGMVPTLSRLIGYDFFSRWECLIVDECQFASSDTWNAVALSCQNAWFRFGLSGTVLTGDPLKDLRLEAAVGSIIRVDGASVRELIDAKYLPNLDLRMYRLPSDCYPTMNSVRDAVCPEWRKDARRLRTKGGKAYALAYDLGIVSNKERNALIVKLAGQHALDGDKVLILVSKIEHGEILKRTFALQRQSVEFLHGSVEIAYREKVLSDFKTGQSKASILIASPIFDSGMDMPEVNAMIQAGAGESPIMIEQRIGRPLRGDKAKVVVYDFLDGRKEERKDYLANHAKSRHELYVSRGFKPKIIKTI